MFVHLDRLSLGEQQTINDSLSGANGFSCPSYFLQICMPYLTPVDLLHNQGEGILDVISKEVNSLDEDPKLKVKSSIFIPSSSPKPLYQKMELPKHYAVCKDRRNGTDKCNFFRTFVLLLALDSNILQPRARIIVIGFALIVNTQFTNMNSSSHFLEELCKCTREMFGENKNYFTTKCHEILWHLATACKLLGNNGVLSTMAFETFYKVLLSDFNTAITNNFGGKVARRFLVDGFAMREIRRRSSSGKSSVYIENFLKQLPTESNSTGQISRPLDNSQRLSHSLNLPALTFYGVFKGTLGRFVSSHIDPHTSNDVVFLDHNEFHCARFVAATFYEGSIHLLVDPVEKLTSSFNDLATEICSLPIVDQSNAMKILQLLRSFNGVVQGSYSGRYILVDSSLVKGIGCRFTTHSHCTFACINGVPIHA